MSKYVMRLRVTYYKIEIDKDKSFDFDRIIISVKL